MEKYEIITIDSIEYRLPVEYYDLLKSMNIKFNKDYIDELKLQVNYLNVDFNNDIEAILLFDYYNKLYIGSKGKLGRICSLTRKGLAIEYYEDIYEAIIDNAQVNEKYYFEAFLEDGKANEKLYTEFFGEVIWYKKENVCCQLLNDVINSCKKILRKDLAEKVKSYKDNYISKMTYFDYALEEVKTFTLELGKRLDELLRKKAEPELKNSSVDIAEKLQIILSRYYIGEENCFKRVKNIKDYKNDKGLFILVLPGKLYVGTADWHRIYDSILNEFRYRRRLGSIYSPNDVSDIYVLILDDNQLMKRIQLDCMGIIGEEGFESRTEEMLWTMKEIERNKRGFDNLALGKEGLKDVLMELIEEHNNI